MRLEVFKLTSMREQFQKEFDIRARTWPAWYYSTRTRAKDKCDMSAQADHVAPLGEEGWQRMCFPMTTGKESAMKC